MPPAQDNIKKELPGQERFEASRFNFDDILNVLNNFRTLFYQAGERAKLTSKSIQSWRHYSSKPPKITKTDRQTIHGEAAF